MHYNVCFSTNVFAYRIKNLTVKPEDVAVPLSALDVNVNGYPVLLFYVQLSDNVFLHSEDLAMAVKVFVMFTNNASSCFVTDTFVIHSNHLTCTELLASWSKV